MSSRCHLNPLIDDRRLLMPIFVKGQKILTALAAEVVHLVPIRAPLRPEKTIPGHVVYHSHVGLSGAMWPPRVLNAGIRSPQRNIFQ